VVIKDFNQFLAEADELEKFKSKFFEFKVKFDFDSTLSVMKQQKCNVNDILTKWVAGINSLEVKDEIIQELTEKVIC